MGELIPFNPLERLSIEQLLNRLDVAMYDYEVNVYEITILRNEIERRGDIVAIMITDGYLDDWDYDR